VLGTASLVRDAERFGWSWRGVDDLRPTWLPAASAVELLTEGDLSRVKDRMKMRRHYARYKKRAH
jgi:hypothetical protein